MSAAALAGAAALAHEIVWTRLLGLALGHEQLGVLAVLGGMFAGMAGGAAWAHGRADRLAAPARVFAGLQVLVAVFAGLAPWLLPTLGPGLARTLGPSPAPFASLLAATLMLSPATVALGASLPILVATRRRLRDDDARGLARLYALDTLGATAGILVMVHLLLPRLGIPLAAAVAAGLGLAAAGLVLRAEPKPDPYAAPDPAVQAVSVSSEGDPDRGLLQERGLLYGVLAATGLLGLGLEVVAVRVLAQVFSGTLYTFADLLAVWLLGTGLGTAVYARLHVRALARRPATVLLGLLTALGLSVALAAVVASAAPSLLAQLSPVDAPWARRQLGELLIAASVLGPPTALMGACFAHLLALIAAPEPQAEPSPPRPIGAALAVNALAAAAAPALFGLVALPSLSYAESWAIIAWGYLVAALSFGWLRRFGPRTLALVAVLGGLGIVAGTGVAGSLVLNQSEGEGEDAGWTVLEQREGPLGVVAVSRNTAPPGSPAEPLMRLRVDGHFRMGGALSIGERRMGHVPALLAGLDGRAARGEDPSVLFLGVGTGATAGAGLSYPIPELSAVELVPDIVELLPYFEGVNAGLATDPRSELVVADARRYLLAEPRTRALIVADLFHPARDGAGSLYAREHFELIRSRLDADGVFVQWLPLYQLDPRSAQIIVATFLAVFPEAHATLALYNVETPALGLIGSVAPLRIQLPALEASLADPNRAELFARLALTDPRDFLAGYVLDRSGLEAFASGAPINEDLHPRIDLWAPRAKLGPRTGADNLETILSMRSRWSPILVQGPDAARLVAYRTDSLAFGDALEHYLIGELILHELAHGPAQLRTLHWDLALREALAHDLEAYRIAPDFGPPRPKLYAAAEADPQLAEWLLPEMLARTPDEPRVHRAWLAHLARIGDRARLEAAGD